MEWEAEDNKEAHFIEYMKDVSSVFTSTIHALLPSYVIVLAH